MSDKDKINMASASWCGFSKKFEKQIKDEGVEDKFNIVYCDKEENKDHAVCKGVQGFPTFKTTNKEKAKEKSLDDGFGECHVGFGPTGDIIKSCQ